MQPRGARRRLSRMNARFALRAVLAVGFSGLLSAVPLSTVLACSCMAVTIPEAFGFADVVFTGTPTAVEAPAPGEIGSTLDPVHYAFAVDKVFKGEYAEPELVATTAMDGASCGTSFAIGERWLVFANVTDGELSTGLCSGNVLFGDADTEAAVLAELGPPIAEPRPATEQPADTEIELPLELIIGLAVAGLVIGVSAWAFLREPGRSAG